MQDLRVLDNGIGYLLKCLNLYMSGTGYFALYLLALLFILIKGSRKDKELFLPQAVVLILTVYNPVVPLVLDRIFDVNSEYYRLFWIAPVTVLVPYVMTTLVDNARAGRQKTVTAILVAALIFAGGSFAYQKGFARSQNIYHIPDELIQVSDIIHEDSGDEYAKAFFEYEYNNEIRQYDPKMLLTVDREQYIYAMNNSYSHEMIKDEETPTNCLLALLVRNQSVGADRFINALEKTKTEYVVLSKGHPQAAFILNAGLSVAGDTPTHVIYRYDVREPADKALIDYSDTEHRFSYRRLK